MNDWPTDRNVRDDPLQGLPRRQRLALRVIYFLGPETIRVKCNDGFQSAGYVEEGEQNTNRLIAKWILRQFRRLLWDNMTVGNVHRKFCVNFSHRISSTCWEEGVFLKLLNICRAAMQIFWGVKEVLTLNVMHSMSSKSETIAWEWHIPKCRTLETCCRHRQQRRCRRMKNEHN